MESIGISVNSGNLASDPQIDTSIQLHLNLWKDVGSKDISYLDIGIMAKFLISEIKIYLPFKLSDNDSCIDLGNVLADHKPILCALFNDDYNISHIQSGCYYRISLSDPSTKRTDFKSVLMKFVGKCADTSKGKKKNSCDHINGTPDCFYLYPLGDRDIEVEKCKEPQGCILTIKVPNQEGLANEDYFYIRFRVPVFKCIGLALKTDLSTNLIQSAFTRMDMYNIQINEKRDISSGPKGILMDSKFNFATFSKVHILYLTNPKVTVNNGSSINSFSRIIEVGKWLDYIPASFSRDTYIAHHWKIESKGGGDLKKANLFFTARYPKVQRGTLLAYLAVVIILGFCGSFLSSFMYGVTSPVFNRWGLWVIIGLCIYIALWWFFTTYMIIIKLKGEFLINIKKRPSTK